MKLIKLAGAVLNTTPLDWANNQRAIVSAISDARKQSVSLLCLPELCITGYGCEDAFHSPGLADTAWRVLHDLLPETKHIAVCLGLPIRYQNGLFDAAAMVVDGRIAGFVCKRFLAGDGIHYEPRWFKPWPTGVVAKLEFDDVEYPLGDIHFDVGGVTVGFEICEDAWVAKRPGGNLALDGVDVILNPSASHFAFGKMDVRKRFVLEGSRAFGCTYVYANLVGNEAGRAIYDGGTIIASGGRIVALSPRFTYADHQLTTAVVDIDATRMTQARTGSFTPDLTGSRADRVEVEFTYPDLEPEKPIDVAPSWENGQHVKEEEFTRAVSLGLFDYMRKSRSGGFVVSLSGGSDSSAVVCLIRTMAELAIADLGLEGVKQKLPYFSRAQSAKSLDDLMRALLITAYQGTVNSSDTTRTAAKELAKAIGAEHLEFDVGPIVDSYVNLVSTSIRRKLTWETDDITLQNIQARVRAPSVWMLANLRNALLLATSDRSEAAVGYATMDGDTAGGLSPIAGIDKRFLRIWLKWLEQVGPDGASRIPILSLVNTQSPKPELRPLEAKQTAETDLMPYDLLDSIERAAIRDKRTPVEVYRLTRTTFTQYEPKQLVAWIERFFRLWCRNQWKRERYAPAFHVDDANLDPKTWCRFPILSGGFERELADLREYAKQKGDLK